MKWGNQIGPCETFNWGEVEDFLIHILPASGISTEETQLAEKDQQRTLPDPTTTVQLYPNPASTLLFVNWELDKERKRQLRLFDRLGREIILPSSNITYSAKQTKIQLPALSNGVYFLELTEEQRTFQKQFIVVR